ncbi:sporulation peptidase YabG [Clostridium sp. BNL1100]|uniref:sporulation peptidase YabG n=1 Tax=Clostridium sp. BNL1100 TaxID=755731 RepID=UPI00024A7682|nr:sporulation peptidase YabG [Clostridium sp. BNL1100]AEY64315.1 YabG peptidase U57 [Clostridium sp. BNL1100]
MKEIELGSLVYRKSYEKDVLFRVEDIKDCDGRKIIILKGVEVRLIADAEEDDLDILDENNEEQNSEEHDEKVIDNDFQSTP